MGYHLKKTSRRFFRINMPLQTFIIPKKSIEIKPIKNTGIHYSNEGVNQSLEFYNDIIEESLGKIQIKDEDLISSINHIKDTVHKLNESLMKISDGENERKEIYFWTKKTEALKEINFKADFIEKSPKTYELLKGIEEKVLHYAKNLYETIENSDEDKFHPAEYLLSFKIDETISRMAEKSEKIPLLKSIVNTYNLAEVICKSIKNMNDDNSLAFSPEKWNEELTNISGSGIAIRNTRLYTEREMVVVKIYLKSLNKIAIFDGRVLSSDFEKESQKNLTRIDFYIPKEANQLWLLTEMQMFEAMESKRKNKNAWSCS